MRDLISLSAGQTVELIGKLFLFLNKYPKFITFSPPPPSRLRVGGRTFKDHPAAQADVILIWRQGGDGFEPLNHILYDQEVVTHFI